MRYRFLAGLLLLTGLTGCDIVTPPERLMNVQFVDEYIPRDEGCNLRMHAFATGGTAVWQGVQLLEGQTVAREYTGEEFWGSPRIMDQEEQVSIPVPLESGRTDYVFEARFDMPSEQLLLRFSPRCPPTS